MTKGISLSAHFDPGEKDGKGHDVVELDLPVGEEFEISEALLILQQLVEDLSHFDLPVDIEGDAHVGDGDDHHVQHVPDHFEVVQFVMGNLERVIVVSDRFNEERGTLTSIVSSMV